MLFPTCCPLKNLSDLCIFQVGQKGSGAVGDVSELAVVVLDVRRRQDRHEVHRDGVRRHRVERQPILVLDPAA